MGGCPFVALQPRGDPPADSDEDEDEEDESESETEDEDEDEDESSADEEEMKEKKVKKETTPSATLPSAHPSVAAGADISACPFFNKQKTASSTLSFILFLFMSCTHYSSCASHERFRCNPAQCNRCPIQRNACTFWKKLAIHLHMLIIIFVVVMCRRRQASERLSSSKRKRWSPRASVRFPSTTSWSIGGTGSTSRSSSSPSSSPVLYENDEDKTKQRKKRTR